MGPWSASTAKESDGRGGPGLWSQVCWPGQAPGQGDLWAETRVKSGVSVGGRIVLTRSKATSVWTQGLRLPLSPEKALRVSGWGSVVDYVGGPWHRKVLRPEAQKQGEETVKGSGRGTGAARGFEGEGTAGRGDGESQAWLLPRSLQKELSTAHACLFDFRAP